MTTWKAASDNWEERWENILELHSAAGEYSDLGPGEGLAAFLQQLALVADVDSYDETVDAITLITLHQAKGLEFPVVFITGMEEGLLPHSRSMDDPYGIGGGAQALLRGDNPLHGPAISYAGL